MTRVLNAASASAKRFPSSPLLMRMKRWWRGKKTCTASVSQYIGARIHYDLTLIFNISVPSRSHFCLLQLQTAFSTPATQQMVWNYTMIGTCFPKGQTHCKRFKGICFCVFSLSVLGESYHERENGMVILTVSDFECPLCIRWVCWTARCNQ